MIEFASDADINVTGYILTHTDVGQQTIPAVDLTKTFLVPGGLSSSSTISGWSLRLFRVQMRFTSATQVELTCVPGWGNKTTQFYVAELSGANHRVESFDSTIPNGATVPTAQPSFPALTDGKTSQFDGWQYWNQEGSSTQVQERDNLTSRRLLGTDDGVHLERVGTGGDLPHTGFAIDWSGAGVPAATALPMMQNSHV